MDGFGGALPVTPGGGVTAPGVSVNEDCVPINSVEVGRARRVGVAGACVAGDVQPTNRINPSRNAGSLLRFIFISSFTAGLIINETFERY